MSFNVYIFNNAKESIDDWHATHSFLYNYILEEYTKEDKKFIDEVNYLRHNLGLEENGSEKFTKDEIEKMIKNLKEKIKNKICSTIKKLSEIDADNLVFNFETDYKLYSIANDLYPMINSDLYCTEDYFFTNEYRFIEDLERFLQSDQELFLSKVYLLE